MRNFRSRDLKYIVGYSEEEKYKTGVNKDGLHIGQLKLFIAELLYLTKNYTKGTVLLYIGSSRGKHINFLPNLFEGIDIHCYDPADSDIDTSIITEHRKLFDEEDVAKWKEIAKIKKVLLISDIRSINPVNIRINQGKEVEEKLIIEDMLLQQSWVLDIQPHSCHLKFRLPYYYKGVNKYFEYLKGDIYIEPWNSSSSTESRLVAYKPYTEDTYNIISYENMCFYHNLHNRGKPVYYNLITGEDEPYNKDLMNDADGTITIYTMMKYLEKYKKDMDVLDFYKLCMKNILYKKDIQSVKLTKDRYIEEGDVFIYNGKKYNIIDFVRDTKQKEYINLYINEQDRDYILSKINNKRLRYIFKWYPIGPSKKYGPSKFKQLSSKGLINYIRKGDYYPSKYYDIIDNCDVGKFINYQSIDFMDRIFNLIRISKLLPDDIENNEEIINSFFDTLLSI